MDFTPVLPSCTQFYRCLSGVRTVQSCPTGTVFGKYNCGLNFIKFINYYRILYLDNVRLICVPASQAKGICGSITGYRKIIFYFGVFIYNLS